MATLVSIEGIGEKYADSLAQAGIGSTGTLLDRGATRSGRKDIAHTAGVTGHQVLAWVNRADLFRIDGVAEEYSDLLEASGVDSVPELAQRNADHLHEKMAEINDSKSLVRRIPNLTEIESWISQAKKLPRKVEH